METKRSVSVWAATAESANHAPLGGDIRADVCVIGAGIAGLTTAYLLNRAGKNVVLIDAYDVGAGETGSTTAHLFPPDEWYDTLTSSFGREKAQLVAQGYAEAIDLVERIVATENIACDFTRLDGYLYAAEEHGPDKISKEFHAAVNAGADVQHLDRVPGLPFDTGPCVRFANQAQFHPLKYLIGLAQAFESGGGRIFGGTKAIDIKRNGGFQEVHTEQGVISAGAVVVATNTPFNDRVVMHTKQSGYQSYVIGIRIPPGSFPPLLLWDTGDPYYYLRLDSPEGEILVVGGKDHKVGQDDHPEHRYAELESWVRERFPRAGEVAYRWSGMVMEPADGLPYLGRNPMDSDNVYVITGDSGNGMTHCTLGAAIVNDLIHGRDNPYADLFDPARKAWHELGEFVVDQANTMSQYSDWLKGGDVKSVDDIPPGKGAIMQSGASKIAAYRSPNGELHCVSAVCTHLGCIVNFNSAEKSWDCPCHASRFGIDGEVLHGPANRPLAKC
jgi:glycine/D-amino acid oxidase-like deaminating enzyme/nitrite reductase/ring-hydroxylating ferredoxin subunit